jgi:hypothetical protein
MPGITPRNGSQLSSGWPKAPRVALRNVRAWSCALASAGNTSRRGPATGAANASIEAMRPRPRRCVRCAARGCAPGSASSHAQSTGFFVHAGGHGDFLRLRIDRMG